MSAVKKTVFIADKINADALARFSGCEDIDVDYRPGLTAQEQHAAVRGAHALIIRSATRVDQAFLDAAEKLELIVRAGVGVDNVDVPAATRRGVAVQNIPDGNTRSAAEHTIALILALARNVPQGHASLKSGEWERNRFVGVELQGKRLGVVGLGKIGRHVASMGAGLGFEVLAFDPFVAPRMAEELGIRLIGDLGELASQVDFLTVHVPKAEGTRALIGEAVLARARAGIRIVNCARGGIVEEAALLAAIERGQVAGAALDVFEKEPPEDRSLIDHPAVVVTPHLGASTREAQENVAVAAADLVVDYLRHGKLHFPVNATALDPELREKAEPYGELAKRLGRIHAQLLEGPPERITVRYFGELFEPQIRGFLTSSVLVGFLSDRTAQPVNRINARSLAKEHGIVVEEIDEGPSRYFTSLLRVEIGSGRGAEESRRVLGGSMRGRSGMRLVSLDDAHFDAVLEGTLLIVRNLDRPGMIGVVGQILGELDVNIANMSLGRHASGGFAVALLNLDHPLEASRRHEILQRLGAVDGILSTHIVDVESGPPLASVPREAGAAPSGK